MLDTYPSIALLDLHGNTNKREVCPDGSPDKNVFDIRQGVAITIAAHPPKVITPSVLHGDLWGTRESKYQSLGSTNTIAVLCPLALEPRSPEYLFHPRDSEHEDEYLAHPSI